MGAHHHEVDVALVAVVDDGLVGQTDPNLRLDGHVAVGRAVGNDTDRRLPARLRIVVVDGRVRVAGPNVDDVEDVERGPVGRREVDRVVGGADRVVAAL